VPDESLTPLTSTLLSYQKAQVGWEDGVVSQGDEAFYIKKLSKCDLGGVSEVWVDTTSCRSTAPQPN